MSELQINDQSDTNNLTAAEMKELGYDDKYGFLPNPEPGDMKEWYLRELVVLAKENNQRLDAMEKGMQSIQQRLAEMSEEISELKKKADRFA
ncbi:hypothetical protein [Moorena sp. SIO3A2]|uniref:hypothetical protein n=1 Tax=Moorena sp. SIO3A2 TaxID=2607841 RepID=UPI0013BDCCDF|nr:hypothetical protein [Moorena sp. SIO3A2]NER90343.1 hypothetical protein [Moorena sp. SIO3A2]